MSEAAQARNSPLDEGLRHPLQKEGERGWSVPLPASLAKGKDFLSKPI
jgi:hypothetical protein